MQRQWTIENQELSQEEKEKVIVMIVMLHTTKDIMRNEDIYAEIIRTPLNRKRKRLIDYFYEPPEIKRERIKYFGVMRA